jgi:hypothetical protein
MKLFKCQNCEQLLYFENRTCENCSHMLGYLAKQNVLSPLEQNGTNWAALATPDGLYRFCANSAFNVCNWLVSADSSEQYCIACRHNRMVPDPQQPCNRFAWYKLEEAKHRLFYTRMNLPLESRGDIGDQGLAFDFLADAQDTLTPKVMTGHDDGLITIALAEADDVERERRRTAMREPNHTLLGHFRHEVGHYYWDRLVRDAFEGLLDVGRKNAHGIERQHDPGDSPQPCGELREAAGDLAHPGSQHHFTRPRYKIRHDRQKFVRRQEMNSSGRDVERGHRPSHGHAQSREGIRSRVHFGSPPSEARHTTAVDAARAGMHGPMKPVGTNGTHEAPARASAVMLRGRGQRKGARGRGPSAHFRE